MLRRATTSIARVLAQHKVTIAVAIFYILLASALTYPFIFHPTTTIIGPNNGDVASSIAKYQAIVTQGANPFTTQVWTSVGYPAGAQANLGVNRVSFLSELYLWVGSLTIGSIATHSLLSFSGFILSALIAYLFTKRITGSVSAGLIAGLVFGFSPHMYHVGRVAQTYAQMWLLLLPLWAFWELAVKGPHKKWTLLAAASLLPAVFWTPYYAFHAGLIAGCGLAVTVFIWLRRKHTLRKIVLASITIGGIWLLGLITYGVIGITSPSTEIPQRDPSDAYTQSAHPLMYLLPSSTTVWGQQLNQLLLRTVPRAEGINLYIGLTTIFLSLLAIIGACKTQLLKLTPARSSRLRVAVLMAALGALACIVFSLAPKVSLGRFEVPMPSSIVTNTVPALRAGQRVVMPLMGVLAVLAGIGALVLLKQLRPSYRPYMTLALMLAVGLDIWTYTPLYTTKVPVQPALMALGHQAKKPTAQIQEGEVVGLPGQLPCILQWQHGQPLINDCYLGRPYNALNTPPQYLRQLYTSPLCDQVAHMYTSGVRYIIGSYNSRNIESCIQERRLGEVLARDQTYTVYKLY